MSGTLSPGNWQHRTNCGGNAFVNGFSSSDSWCFSESEVVFSRAVVLGVFAQPVAEIRGQRQTSTTQQVAPTAIPAHLSSIDGNVVGFAFASTSYDATTLGNRIETSDSIRAYLAAPALGSNNASASSSSVWAFTISEPLDYTVTGSIASGSETRNIAQPPPPSSASGPRSSQQLPIFPIASNGSSWEFSGCYRCDASGKWIDPPMASVYDFEMHDDALFTKIASLPVGVGGMVLGTFAGGSSVDFVQLLGSGVSSFQVAGIDPALDGANPLAFPIQLDFDTDVVSFRMTPVPEPGTAALVLLGLTGVFSLRRKNARN